MTDRQRVVRQRVMEAEDKEVELVRQIAELKKTNGELREALTYRTATLKLQENVIKRANDKIESLEQNIVSLQEQIRDIDKKRINDSLVYKLKHGVTEINVFYDKEKNCWIARTKYLVSDSGETEITVQRSSDVPQNALWELLNDYSKQLPGIVLNTVDNAWWLAV